MEKLARFTPNLIFSFLQWPSPGGSPSLASLGNVLEKRSEDDWPLRGWLTFILRSWRQKFMCLVNHTRKTWRVTPCIICWADQSLPYVRWNSEACFIGYSRAIMRSMRFLVLWDSLVNLWKFQLESSSCTYFFSLLCLYNFINSDHWFLPLWPPLNSEILSLRLSMVSHTFLAIGTCIH